MNFEALKYKKILITGGTGFFGKNLCDFLLELNTRYNLSMTIFVMARKEIAIPGVIFIKQDISQEISFNEKLDYIIHAATPVVNDHSTSEELLSIIINGTQRVAQLALKTGCSRFLHISSGGAYGAQPAEIEKLSESYFDQVTMFDPKNPYGTGKRLSEIIVRDLLKNSETKFVIARCFAFSGKYLPLDQHFAIGNFVKDAIDTKKINVLGDGSAIRSYMDSADLCQWLLVMLLEGKSSEAYNIGSDEAISILELANKIAGMTDATVHVQNQQNETVKKNRYVPSINKAQSELGLSIKINLNHSLTKMIEIYRTEK